MTEGHDDSSGDGDGGCQCVGEITTYDVTCSGLIEHDSCLAEGVSVFSDGICDWVTTDGSDCGGGGDGDDTSSGDGDAPTAAPSGGGESECLPSDSIQMMCFSSANCIESDCVEFPYDGQVMCVVAGSIGMECNGGMRGSKTTRDGCDALPKCQWDEGDGGGHDDSSGDGDAPTAAPTTTEVVTAAPTMTEVVTAAPTMTEGDDTSSGDGDGGCQCVGEITSQDVRCSLLIEYDGCLAEGVSIFSDGICDWVTTDGSDCPAPTAAPTMTQVVTEAMTEAAGDDMTEAAGDDMTEAADDTTEAAGDDMTEAAGDDMTEAAPATFTISGEISLGYPSALSDDQIATEEGNVETTLVSVIGGTADCTMTADAGAQRRMLAVDYTAAFTVAGVSAEKSAMADDTVAIAGVTAAIGEGSAFNVTVTLNSISAAANTEAPSASPTILDDTSSVKTASLLTLTTGFVALLIMGYIM